MLQIEIKSKNPLSSYALRKNLGKDYTIAHGTLPESWDTADEAFIYQLARCADANCKVSEAMLWIIKERLLLSNANMNKLTADNKAILCEKLSFITKEKRFNKWLLPSVAINGTTRTGPIGILYDFTAADFQLTEEYFGLYAKVQKREYLVNLALVCYRIRKNQHTPRIPLNVDLINIDENAISQWPNYKLIATLICYEGLRNNMLNAFAKVFEPIAGETKTKSNTQNPWPKITRLCAGGIFGDLDATKNALMWDILAHLLDEREKSDAMRK